jgi:integrase
MKIFEDPEAGYREVAEPAMENEKPNSRRKRIRGMGRVYQPTYKDKKTGEVKTTSTWWIQYCRRGKPIRESADSTKERDAWKLLKQRHAEMASGKPVGPDVEHTTFEDLAAMITADYKANDLRSLNRCEDAISHLREYFGNDRAIEITSDRVTKYIAHRKEVKASNSTINKELSALGRMLTLAIRAGKAAQKPYIAKLEEHNVRKGFFEHEQLNAVLKHLPQEVRPVLETAYITGWRIRDELVTRQRHHVDLKAGWVRLEPGETKNGEGRNFPLSKIPRLREVLEKQIVRTEALQKATGRIIPWLFHRDGKPIKSFRRSWLTACKNAGLPGKIPHDFRRTAVRNLERAGVPRSAAKKMVGHKTDSIYERYAIADEAMLQEAGEKLQRLYSQDQQAAKQKTSSGE